MPDRLAELRRQRALLEEHLAWLDREITRETHGLPSRPPEPVAPRAPRAPLAPRVAAAPAPSVAPPRDFDAMLDEYRVPAESLRTDVRKGCFLYFAAALALLALVVSALYFALTRR